MKAALTIVESDFGRGTGIQAGLKRFSAQGVFGMPTMSLARDNAKRILEITEGIGTYRIRIIDEFFLMEERGPFTKRIMKMNL